MADLLGFDGVIEHTRDAMWQTDGLHVGDRSPRPAWSTTLAKLAEDLEIWSSSEFGYVTLAEGHTRSSVLMPQKRNPYALTMVRGEAGILIGRPTGMLAVAKSPSARSDNLIFAYGEVPRALDLAGRATRLMAGVVGGLSVHAERMYAALESGFAQAADLAEYLMVTCGLDYRIAYDLVGDVRAAGRRRPGCAGWTSPGRCSTRRRPSSPRPTPTGGAAPAFAGTDLSAVLDPRAIVRSRSSARRGGPGRGARMAKDCLDAATAAALATVRARRAGFERAEAEVLRHATAAAPVTESRNRQSRQPERNTRAICE